MTTFQPDGIRQLQLGEGLLLANADLDVLMAAEDPAAHLAALLQRGDGLLGATPGGCVFRCVPAPVSADPRTLPQWQVTLSGHLLTPSPASAAWLLNIRPHHTGRMTAIAPPDDADRACMSSLLWVGCTASGLLLLELTDPVSTVGLQLCTYDYSGGRIPFAFAARQRRLPRPRPAFRLAWLEEGGA